MSETASTKRKRVTKAPEVRREDLLQAASTLFLEKGIAATGIGDITDRAAVARGTFYLYFSSKDEVVSALWRRYVDGFLDLADAVLERETGGAEDVSRILDLIVRLTEHALDHAHLHRLVYGSADAAAIALCRRSDEAIIARLTDAIRAYFRSSGRQEQDADLVALLLFHGLDGALHSAITQDREIDSAAFVQGIKRFTAKALAGGA